VRVRVPVRSRSPWQIPGQETLSVALGKPYPLASGEAVIGRHVADIIRAGR
jgi:hypothetical protein